jgi:hypothetical protein
LGWLLGLFVGLLLVDLLELLGWLHQLVVLGFLGLVLLLGVLLLLWLALQGVGKLAGVVVRLRLVGLELLDMVKLLGVV